jgi:hypothetical protein
VKVSDFARFTLRQIKDWMYARRSLLSFHGQPHSFIAVEEKQRTSPIAVRPDEPRPNEPWPMAAAGKAKRGPDRYWQLPGPV